MIEAHWPAFLERDEEAGGRPRFVVRTELETLAHPAHRDAHVELRRLGLWSHNGLLELVAERGPRFRRVLGLAEEPRHALGAYRAAIAGTLSIERAVALITEGAAHEDVAGLSFEPAERAYTVAVSDTPERRRRERDLAMRRIDWLRGHCDNCAALLDRYVASPFVLAPILLIAVLDASVLRRGRGRGCARSRISSARRWRFITTW